MTKLGFPNKSPSGKGTPTKHVFYEQWVLRTKSFEANEHGASLSGCRRYLSIVLDLHASQTGAARRVCASFLMFS